MLLTLSDIDSHLFGFIILRCNFNAQERHKWIPTEKSRFEKNGLWVCVERVNECRLVSSILQKLFVFFWRFFIFFFPVGRKVPRLIFQKEGLLKGLKIRRFIYKNIHLQYKPIHLNTHLLVRLWYVKQCSLHVPHWLIQHFWCSIQIS